MSNTFTLEWLPQSGQMHELPEVDRAAWFDLTTAGKMISRGQIDLLDELESRLSCMVLRRSQTVSVWR